MSTAERGSKSSPTARFVELSQDFKIEVFEGIGIWAKALGQSAMPYNKHLGYPAPLPSGALPTDEELSWLVWQSRQRQLNAIAAWFRRFIAR